VSLTLPATISAGIASGCTTATTLWKITRTDAQVFGFTQFNEDIVWDGVTYLAATGYTRTAVSSDASLGSDSVDLDGVLDADCITEADLLAGVWDHARLDIMLIDWADRSDVTIIKSGWLGEVHTGGVGFRAELMGLASALAQNVIDITTPTCRATLGDARCGKSLAAFTFSATVTDVTDRRSFATTLANSDGYFVGGRLVWVTGANAGRICEIKTSLATGAVSLFLPADGDVVIGDSFNATIGCDKTVATCAATFSNAVNFRGEPYLPGTHFMVKGPT
jgi:uncharacterized phage protein (TIGR02218 family)